jgi:opacity protein-like surface antigen
MPECTSTSEHAAYAAGPCDHAGRALTLALALTLLAALAAAPARAQTDATPPAPAVEDGDTAAPFTRYGEFNDEEDEAADTLFFQYGRLFGVSAGSGFQGVTGNRGALYQGGFPAVDLRVHFWFDFQFAMSMNVGFVQHTYQTSSPAVADRYVVDMYRLGLDMKYYFDVKDLAAPIAFANPHVIIGGGAFTKTERSEGVPTPDTDTRLGFSLGAGLEFALRPRKAYFYLDGRVNYVQFEDTRDSDLAGGTPRIADRTGLFYGASAGILFTW